MKTLPDYLRTGLRILSIGLNPSLKSVEFGFYFANPRNRFWRALDGSGLVPEALVPGELAQARLFEHYAIGFTDLVKRPTAGSSDLRAKDFREAAPILREKILTHVPSIAWFHGKHAYRNYLRQIGKPSVEIDWGTQPERIGASLVFVTPNPSPANAVFSLATLTQFYAALNELSSTQLSG